MQAPFGSSFNDPRFRSQMRAMAEAQASQPAQAEDRQALPHPFGSGFNDPDLRAALQTAGQNGGQPPAFAAQVKNGLNGGELSPDMQARYDLPRYQLGCEKLLNMIPLPGGGVTKRPGLQFVSGAGSPGDGSTSRLVPFTYSAKDKLMLMFLANKSGGQVWLLDRDGKPGAVAGPAHPYHDDELPLLYHCQAGKFLYLAHANHAPARLVWDGANFTYEVLDFGNHVPIPSIAGFSYEGLAELFTFRNQYYKVTAISDETGEESYPSEEAVWYTCTLTPSFSAVISINPVPGCSEYRIYKKRGGEYGYIGRISYDWEYAAQHPQAQAEDGIMPLGASPDIATVPPGTGIYGSNYRDEQELIEAKTVLMNRNREDGRDNWTEDETRALLIERCGSIEAWFKQYGAAEGLGPSGSEGGGNEDGGSEGGGNEGGGNEGGMPGQAWTDFDNPNVFHDIGYEPDVSDPPPRRQDFFTGPGNYPSVVFLHQQRLGWAATDNDPLTIWMSQTSNYNCLASKQPPRDDDGIEATLASSQANRILWAISDRSGLALGTEGEEWYMTGAGGEGAVVTPNSVSFQPQTRYGSQPGVIAERADASLLFLQRGGRIVRDLGYSFQGDRYEARDLTLLARHIFTHNAIVDWCWQGSPHYILWCVLANGKLAGLTYMPDNDVLAWHRHETPDGFIQSCAALDDSEGYSRLWLVVDRRGEGAQVEMMELPVEPDVEDWDRVYAPPWERSHTDGRKFHTFAARVIPCLPEAGMENGATAMRVRKINAVTCRVINSYPFACHVLDQYGRKTETLPMPVRAPANPGRESFVRAADWSCDIGAGFRQGSRLELVCDGPAPVTVLGVVASMDVAREAATQTGA